MSCHDTKSRIYQNLETSREHRSKQASDSSGEISPPKSRIPRIPQIPTTKRCIFDKRIFFPNEPLPMLHISPARRKKPFCLCDRGGSRYICIGELGVLYVRDDGIREREREREKALGLRCRVGFGFPKSRCIYTKGDGVPTRRWGCAPRGSLEVSRDAPGRRRGGWGERLQELLFSLG